ncbi:hypothetical protein [Chitinimonas naiadis]
MTMQDKNAMWDLLLKQRREQQGELEAAFTHRLMKDYLGCLTPRQPQPQSAFAK